ncbi:MAG: hypothetical protein AAGC56_14640 [Pseudomonadota bacterium]
MKTVEVSTYLDAEPAVVFEHAKRPALLQFVSRGFLRFKPLEPTAFPEVWAPGAYRVAMHWKGFLPLGWQVIGIEIPPVDGETYRLRDNGHGPNVAVWDHMVEISPEGRGARYVDRLRLDAGAMTPATALFARRFYTHRQKRWRLLVSRNFDYGS